MNDPTLQRSKSVVAALTLALAAHAQDLTWEQLVARRDLWPAECTVRRDLKFDTGQVAAGTVGEVTELTAKGAHVEFLAQGLRLELAPADTDALELANTTFAALAPAERQLDAAAMAQRAALWPKRVKVLCSFAVSASQRLDKGTMLDFGSFDGTWIRARCAQVEQMPSLPLHVVDFAALVRSAAAAQPRPSPHRVLAELDGKLVNTPSGLRAKVSADKPPQYVVLYFSAGWCAPCRQFSPHLVDFYNAHKRDAGKRFEVVWISRDHDEAGMRDYWKKENFPWPAVSWGKLGSIPVTQAHAPMGIPDLVVLDATGALVADSYRANEYVGAATVLRQLEALLQQK